MRLGYGVKVGLGVLGVVLAWTAWWWIDSAITCADQDEYTIHGVCLIKLRNRAEEGHQSAQWAYGNYLLQDEPAQGYAWIKKAIAQPGTGEADFHWMPLLCYARAQEFGITPDEVKSFMLRVVKENPNSHRDLLYLYMNESCPLYDLAQAAAQIEHLTQCADSTLVAFLNKSAREQFEVSSKILNAMKTHLQLCRKELSTKRIDPPERTAEFVAPYIKDVERLDARVNALLRGAANKTGSMTEASTR